MKRAVNWISMERFLVRSAVASSLGVSLLCASVAYGDSPVSLAPPIQADSSAGSSDPAAVDQDSVFNWSQVPSNQQVDIQRATFDKGGYVLYDTSGDTIVIPFVNNNLYVMKFARSDNGDMYFVNDGTSPILYVPVGGYLENATVPGAHWCPITDDFQPDQPVYMGIAPSWNDYVSMGWYPDFVCNGGYYCDVAYGAGDFFPCDGFGFVIGGFSCSGWNDYRSYCIDNRPPFRTRFFNHGYYAHGIGFGHTFPDRAFRNSGDRIGGGGHDFNGGTHDFNGGAHTFGGSTHTFQGTSHDFGGSTHTFQGGSHEYGGSGHTFSGSDEYGGHGYDYGRSAGSIGSSGGSHSFGGGSSGSSGGRSFGGGGRSSGGGGDHSSGGGGDHSSGGGGGHSSDGGGDHH